MNYSNRGARVWDYTIEKVVKRADLVNGVVGSLKVVSHTKQRYQDYSLSGDGGDQNGKRMMESIVAPDSTDPQVTMYDYYDNRENRYVNGRLKSRQNPGGSWEYWEYTDSPSSVVAVETRYTPWKDSTFANYQSGLKQKTTITPTQTDRVQSVGGVVIAKERFTTAPDPQTGRLTYTQEKWDGQDVAHHFDIELFSHFDIVEKSSNFHVSTDFCYRSRRSQVVFYDGIEKFE